MRLFHPDYSGVDVGVGGRQYRVERANGGAGAYVNVPDELGHLLFDHGFRKIDAIDIDAVAREAMKAQGGEEGVKKAPRAKA